MFENLLFQERLVAQLAPEIRSRQVPPSLLFHGPAYSAKLTAALETARSLSCRRDGAWACPCDACRTHRTLDYPWLVLTGHKNLLPEIEAGAALLDRHRTDARRYFLLRAVKKLLKRFDPLLWDGEEHRLKGTSGPLTSLQEELDGLYPPEALPEGPALGPVLERIVAASRSLNNALPSGGVPIHQVRHLAAWARTATSGDPKFVILQNADHMPEGSRNALLKILEEPPANTWLMLLTSQRGALLPTVQSRLRAFALAGRSPEQEQAVLGHLFQAEPGAWSGLADYFQAFDSGTRGLYADLASRFLAGLGGPAYPLDVTAKFWGEDENFALFLAAVAARLRAEGPSARPLRVAQGLYALLQEARVRRDTYNLSPALLVETLFYQAAALDRPA